MKDFIYSKLFFNAFIRIFIQSYLTLVLASYFNLQSLVLKGKTVLVTSSIVALLFGSFLTAYPLLMFSFLKYYKNKLKLNAFKKRVGTMYSGLELDGRMSPLLYNVIFVGRRLIFTWSIIFFDWISFFQIQVLIFTGIGVTGYTLGVQPFIDDSDDILDIFNEICILVLCYMCVTYTAFVPDNKTKYDIGWFAIAIFGINLLSNLSYIIIKTVAHLIKLWKARKAKKADKGKIKN